MILDVYYHTNKAWFVVCVAARPAAVVIWVQHGPIDGEGQWV